MALEKVLGLEIHNDHNIGTINIVVSFPGIQPIQYLTAVS
jgi:hypothetical protein